MGRWPRHQTQEDTQMAKKAIAKRFKFYIMSMKGLPVKPVSHHGTSIRMTKTGDADTLGAEP